MVRKGGESEVVNEDIRICIVVVRKIWIVRYMSISKTFLFGGGGVVCVRWKNGSESDIFFLLILGFLFVEKNLDNEVRYRISRHTL